MSTQTLEASGLCRRIAGRQVLDQVSLEVRPGEVVGLLGPNGAGKSTLFRLLMGLDRPDAGVVRWCGQEITDEPTHRRARLGLGYLPQEPSAFLGLSAARNLEAVLELRGRSRAEAAPLLEALSLTPRRDQLAATLSGGERRRLEIARLLATRPSLLLLDEPLRGLDPAGLAALQGAVARLAGEGAGVLLTDHPVEEALAICHRLYILVDGRVIAAGSAAEVRAHPAAQRSYFGWAPVPGEGQPSALAGDR